MNIIFTKYLAETYRRVMFHLVVSRSNPAGLSLLFQRALVPQVLQKVIGCSCFLAIGYSVFLQFLMSLLNVSMIDGIINKSLAYRGINALSQLGKQLLSQFEAHTHFEFTFHV